jgi:LuxR family transcriptional regulator, quorum-sensing system regulator BjaR1
MYNERLSRALDFAELISSAQTMEDTSESLSELASDFGFSIFVLATFTGPGSLTEPYLLASNWNPEWRERYLQQQYILDDPVVARAVRDSTGPFRWSDTRQDKGVTKRGERILDEAREFDMKDGIFIPVYGTGGCEGTLVFGGTSVDLSPGDMKALHLAGLYSYDHSFKLALKPLDTQPSATELTGREIECLRWTAAGRTSSAIADTLGLSRHTVDWYLKEATLKLGARNRTHAVAEAFRRRIVA